MKIKGQKKLSISIVVIILLLIIIATEIIVNTETKADYSGTTSDNLFEYTVDTDRKYVLITKYIGSQQRVIIPSTIDNYPVKAITTTALKNCTTAEYIYIPSTIVEIGSSGIGDKYKIEADAFSGCNNLNTVEIDSNNQYYANNNGDGIIYNKAKTKIYYCPNAKEISSLTIADGVTTICTSAFARCKTLNEVVMPESLISINNNAFRNCENLSKVTLKDGIKNIGHGAFGWCEKLTQINIPNTVEIIDDYALEECHELTNINIPSSVTSISTSTFHNCHKLISINVASENNSYTNYNDDGILYDKNMKTIVRYPQAKAGTKYTIPDNITEIADKAFWRCNNLTQVTIPNTVTTIGESAFHYCENLTQITIPYNVTRLERSTFGSCTNLSKVNLPDSIIAIDSMTFSDCTSLTEIEIPGSTTSMENTVFSDCTNLKRVIIPDSVTSMGYNIFRNDTNIKIVTKSNSTAHQYATSNSIAVELDNTSPTIQSITYSTKETTNGSVKVTITANEPLQSIVSDNRTWEYVPNTGKKSITAQISSNTINEALTIKDLVGNTATATINVNNIDTTPPVATVTMDKDSYKSGETATITAVFNEPVQDGTPQIVIARNNFRYEIEKMTKQNNYTYVYYHDTAKLEGDQRVEISEACDLAGNVMETVSKDFYVTPTLKRIDVTTQPNKNTYTVGENFDTTGMKITAVYGDNTSKEVTDYTVVDGTNLQLGKTCVIISYTDGEITKTVLVFISVVENIDNLFEYKVISDGGYISITKYIGNKQSVTIPSMINNYPVKTIAQLAFKDCTTVKYIYIPSSIEGIGTDEIGDTAKYESSVFVGCSNLNTVEIDPNNQYYTNNNEDGVIYDKNKTKLYYYPTAKTGSSFTIIDGVTSIEQNAFADCKNINTIVTPKGLATLGAEAFLNCTNLSKITLNEGLKTIEINAFGLCESLEEIKLPNTVETIGLIAFQGCIKLTKIDIPISTTFIEPGAFLNCSKLASINVDSLNNNYTNYNNDGVLYTKDMTTIVRYPQAKSGTEYTISNSTTKIDYQAFKQCNNLTKVEMPDMLTFIDASAFENCSNLQQITIPEGITELSYFIFSKCSSLKEVNLPDTLKEISRSTFDECTSLKEIIIPGNVTKIADFTNCTNLNKVIIPDSGIDIMSGSFSGAENLTIVTKSNSTAHQFATNNNINVELDDTSPTIESIVYSPDEITSGSVKVTITANEPLQKIVSDNRTWKYVPNTDRKSITTEISSNTTNETLTIKDLVGNTATAETTVTENIDNEFEYKVIDSQYVSITKYIGNKPRVIVPSTINNYPVKTIAQTAFKNCTTVEYVYIPSTIVGIGLNEIDDPIKVEADAFGGCSNLNTVEIDSNNQYYTNNNGDGIIYDKNKTKLYYYPTAKTDSSFTIIDGVTSIEYRAFANCTNINTVVAPKGLTTIGTYAFLDCTNLSRITLNEGLKTIDVGAFESCKSLKEIKLPSTVETIGTCAFQECVELTKIDIPSSTTSIESDAFSRCFKLASINVDSANNNYTNYNNDGVLYNKDMTTILRYPQAKAGTEYTISNNITKIGYQAFEQCNNLTKVEIPDTVTFIDAFAFARSKNLQQITIPEGVTELSYFIFSECSSLKEVNLPDTLKEISRSTFDGCTSLEEIIIPGNVTKIDDFTNCTNLNKAIIPDSVTDITSGSFAGANNLTIVTKSNSTAHQFATNNNINVKLDDTSPTIESIVYSTDETTDGSVKVIITANEPLQKIVSDNRTWKYVPNTDKKSITTEISSNTTNETITLKDLVGNTTTAQITTTENIDNEFEYKVIDSQYVSITKYIGNKPRVIVPSTINNYPVKTIAQTAFKNCTTVEYVYIPSSIEEIGTYPIGDKIKNEASTFIGCSNLNTVEIDLNNQYYTNNNGDGVIYDKNKTKLYYYPTAKTGSSFTIINGITSIEGSAFADCKNINTIVTPEGLTIIGAEAFANCKNLSKITLNEGLKTINVGAFELCKSLEEIKLPSTVETIGSGAFLACVELTKIDIPISTISIDASAFLNCSSLASINVDSSNNSYTNYNNDGVLYTKDMTTIVRYPQAKVGTEYTISSNTTKIDYQAFEKCYNLTKVEIPGTVTFIGAYAFSGCRNLQQITIPEGVTEIGEFAFHQARSLTKVTIPKGVSVIKMGTFMGCTELTEVTISKNVTTIKEGAFNGCTGLTEVIIPGNTTSIYNTAFDSCLKLNKIIIPDSVISIGDTTFNNDKDFTIFTKSNSIAHQFATNNNINVELDDTSPTIESIVYSTDETTDGSVKVIITANEPIQDIVSDGRDWEYVPNTNRKSIMAKMQNNIANEELTIKDLVGNKTTVTVNTKDTDTTPPTVTITTDKEKYNSGETVVITATFNEPIEDGTPKISILQNNVTKVSEKMSKQNEYTYTYSYNTTTASGEQKIIISEACDLAGNVMESKEKSIYITTILTKIEVTTQPSKTTYIEGQNFDKTGMKVTATYNNGTTKEVTNYTITDGNNLTVGKTSITISYTEDGVTKTTTVQITVNKKSLSKIEVTTQPSKTTYIEGQNFDKTGMKVTATYNDGTTKEVTNYTITDGNNLTIGKTSVTVSYTEDGITKTTTVQITVTAKQTDKLTVEFNQYNEVDNNNRKYLCNISPETTLEKMKENITTNGTIKVYSNNKEITGSKDLVTTSMKLEISLDDEKLELTIVVKGDTNGDGKSDLYDILEINKHRLNKALLTNERLLAGNVDNNNKVDIDDILRINKFRLGKINVL